MIAILKSILKSVALQELFYGQKVNLDLVKMQCLWKADETVDGNEGWAQVLFGAMLYSNFTKVCMLWQENA